MVKSYIQILFFGITFGVLIKANAQTYYSQGDDNFSTLSNWTENADGTGANPVSIGNFDFIIQNGHTIAQDIVLNIGNLTVEGGGTFNGGVDNLVVNGDLEVQNTANFTATTVTTSITEDVIINGTFNANGGTVSFIGTNATNFTSSSATTFNNLSIDKTDASNQVVVQTASSELIATNTSINSGRLNLQSFANHNDHNLGTITGTSSGTLRLGKSSAGEVTWPSGDFSVFFATAGTTIDFLGSTDYSLPSSITTYQNLLISGSSVKTATAGLTISGNITIEGGATLADGGFAHTVSGNWTEDSGSMTGSGTIQFTTGAHQITSSGDAIDFNSIAANAGATLSFDETSTINITGNFSTFGNCNNLVVINSVAGGNQTDLNISSSPTWDAVSVVDINEIGAGTITINQGTISNTANIAAPAGTCDVLYWVGGAGDWSSAAEWSATSGGPGGAGVPTATTDVIFDANSFTAAGQRVRVRNGSNPAACKNMDWSAVPAGLNPQFASDNRDLEIYGSLTMNADMNWNFNREIRFRGAGNFSITTMGTSPINDFQFNNVNGAWTLQDAFTSTDDIELVAGTLNTNNQDFTVRRFDANVAGNNNRELNLTTSNLTLTGNGNEVLDVRGSNFLLNAGTSTITFTNTGNHVRVELGTNDRTFYDLVIDGGRNDREVIFRNGSNAASYIANNITVNSTRRLSFDHSITVNGVIDALENSYVEFQGTNNVFHGVVNIASINNGSYNIRFGDAASDVNTFNAAVNIAGTTQNTDRIRFYQSTFNSTVTLSGSDPRARFYDNCTFNGFFSASTSADTRFYDNDRFYAGATFGDYVRFTEQNTGGTSTQFIGNFPVVFPDNAYVEGEQGISFGGTVTFGNAADMILNDNGGSAIFSSTLTFGDNTSRAHFDRNATFEGDVTFGTGTGGVDFDDTSTFNGALTINGTATNVDAAVQFHGNNTFGDGVGNDAVNITTDSRDWALRFEGGGNSNTFASNAPVTIGTGSRILVRGTSDMGSTLGVGDNTRILFAWDGGTSRFRGNVTVGNSVRFEPRRDTQFDGDLVFGDAADARFNEVSGATTVSGVTTFGNNTVEAWFDRNSTLVGVVTFGTNTGTGGERIRFDGTSMFQGGFTLNGTNANATRVRFWGTNLFSGGAVTLNGVANQWSIRFEDNSQAIFAGDAPVTIGDNSAVWLAGTSVMNSTLNVGNDVDIIFADNQGTSTFVGNVTVGNNVFFEPRRQATFMGNLVFGEAADARFNSDDGTTTINGVTTFGNNTVEAFFDRGSTHVGLVTFGTNSGTGGERLRFDGTSTFQGGFLLQGTPASNSRVRFFGTNDFSGGTVDFTTGAADWAVDFDVNATSTFAADAPVIFRNAARVRFRGNDTFDGTVTGEDNVRVLFTGDWNNARTTAINNTLTFGNDVYLASYHDFSVTGDVSIGDGAEFHITDNTGTSSFGGTVTFGNNTIEAFWDQSSSFAGKVTFGTNSGTGMERIRWDGTTDFNGGLEIQGTPGAHERVRFFGPKNFAGGAVDITTGDSGTNWAVDFDDNTTVICAADAPVIIRNGSHVRFRGDDTFNGTFTAEDNTFVRFTGDWNNEGTSTFNGVTTFGNNVQLTSYHSFNCTSTLTVGDNAHIHLLDRGLGSNSATFDGAVTIGSGVTRFYLDRSNTFNSTLNIGDNASNVIFADAGGITTFNGDVTLGASGNIRFDNRITANNQNITVGAETRIDFNTTNSPNTLHNVTLTQANEVIFEREDDFNFTGQILFSGAQDCTAAHFIRSDDWNRRPNLSFTTAHTWYGVIAQSLNVTSANITAQYSTSYRNNAGITFDNSYVNTTNSGLGSQDLYWVGGHISNTRNWPFAEWWNIDDWNNPQNWSTISGGASGSCIPRAQHNVIFDANSFDDGVNLTVHVNTATAAAHDMTWTAGVLNDPTLNIDNDLTLSGSLSLSSNPMAISGDDDLFFISTDVETITSNGTSLENDDVILNGVGGSWTIQDNFIMGDKLMLQSGSFIVPDGLTAAVDEFDAYRNRDPNPDIFFSDTRVLTLGNNAILQIDGGNGGGDPGFDFRGSGFTLTNPGTNSKIVLATSHNDVDWYDIRFGNPVNGDGTAKVIPDIEIGIDVDTGPDDVNFQTEEYSIRLTFREIRRVSTNVAMNFEVLGRTPKTYGNINMGDNMNNRPGNNFIRGNLTTINYFNGTVDFGDNADMDFEGLNYFAQNVTFGDNANIEFDNEPHYFTGGANLTFGNNATFNSEDTLDITGDMTFGTTANARMNDSRGYTEVDGMLTIGADANEVVFERTGIYNGVVSIGNNAIVQFSQGGTSTFNGTVTTGTSSFVRFRETATFNAELTTGASSRAYFAEGDGHTYFNSNASLGNNSNNIFYEDVTFDTSIPGTYTLTYGDNSVTSVEDDQGDYDNILLNVGASVVYDNDNNNYHNITLTNFNTIELSNDRLSTITGTFAASVTCSSWGIVRSSVQGSQANINFTSPQTWDNIVVQDLDVNNGSALLTITDGVNLRNLTDTDGTTYGTQTIDITERAPIDFYWTADGGDGLWSNPNNWATGSSSGASNGCIPNPIDNVTFDNGSFDAADNRNVIIDITNAACFSMAWDLDEDVVLNGPFAEDRMMIFNDLTWDERIDNQFPGIFEFQSNARYENEISGGFVTNTISTDAGLVNFNGGVTFDADQNQTIGNWSLQAGIDINDGVTDINNAYFNIVRGVFDANQQAINVEGDFILEDAGRYFYNLYNVLPSDGGYDAALSLTNVSPTTDQIVTFDGDVTDVNIFMRDDDNPNPFHNIVINKSNAAHDVRIRTEHFRIENDLTITQGRFWDSDEGNGGPYAIRNAANTAASLGDPTTTTGGIVTIEANGSLMLGDNNSNNQSEFPLVFSSVSLDPASTVVYRGRREQNVTALNDYWAGVQYGNLTLTNGDDRDDRAKQLQGAITVRGNLRIEDSYFFDNGHQVTGNTGGTSSFTMTGDSRFFIGVIGLVDGDVSIMPDFDTYDLENNTWVRYQSDQPQTIKGIDDGGAGRGSYGNISIRNDNNAAVTTSVLKTLDAPLRVRREMHIGADTEFWDDGNQITALDDNNCELFVEADAYLRLGNATDATIFPSFQSDEIFLRQGSTVVYAAGVAQDVRRLAQGDDDRGSYWNIWMVNSDSASTPATPPTKTLAASPVPRNGSDNLRFRKDFKVGEYTHLVDNGYQINGENADATRTDIVWVGQQSILTLGTATTATEFPRHTTVANIDLHETSHVIYNAGVNQTVRGISNLTGNDPTGNSNYGFLTITNVADAAMRDKTLDEAIGVRRTFIVNNNVDVNDAGFQIYGVSGQTLDVNGNGILTLGVAANATEFPFNYANADIDLESATTVVYNAGVAQEVRRLSSATANQNYANLIIRNDGGSGMITKTLTTSPATADVSTNTKVRGILQVQSNSDFVDDGHQIVGEAGQTMELQSASQLTIGNSTVATVFPENYTDADLNIDASSIVEYSAGVAQNVRGLNSATDSQVYGEIHFNNASDKTLLAALRYRTNMLMYTANNVYDAGFQITGANGATFEMQGNSQFYIGDAVQVGATRFPIDVLNDDVALSATSTINYQDNEPQLVRKLGGAVSSAENYGNLTLTNSTKTIAATPNATAGYLDNLHVRGMLNLGAVDLSLNDQRLVLSGTLSRTTGAFVGSDDSKLTVRGSGALGAELHFDTPGTDISDLLINRTGGVTITLGTNLTVGTNPGFNGSVTLTEGVFALNNQHLQINSGANQFTRANGTFYGGVPGASNNSVLIIRGTGDFGDALVFSPEGQSKSEVMELGIDRAGRMTMGSPLEIRDKLGLKNGIIETDATNYITMGPNAGIRDFNDADAPTSIHPGGTGAGSYTLGSFGGSPDSHIEGPMAKVFGSAPGSDRGFRFPIGKGGKLREIGVAEVGRMEAEDGLPVDFPTTFLAEYINAAPVKPGQSGLRSGSNMTHVSSVEYWNLDRIDGDAAARVIMHFDTDTDVATDESFYDNLRVAHYDETLEEWESEGESNERAYDAGLGYIISPDFSDNFSPFTFGSTSLLNLLPIELKSFNARLKEDRKVELTWEAIETNSEGYILKRSIGDSDNFVEIASYIDDQSLVSKNDTESISSYVYLDDENIQPGEVHYYKLEQVDKDGNATSFDVKAVNVGARVVLYQNHPNPASHNTTIGFSIEKEARTKLEVFDMSGRYVSTIVNDILEIGTHQYDYDVSDLQTGVYTVKMTYGDKVLNIKMLVTR